MQTFHSFDPQYSVNANPYGTFNNYLNRTASTGCQTQVPPERGGFYPKQQSFYVGSTVDNVFFHPDRFEIYVDVRGFLPKNIQVMVQNELIQVLAVQPLICGTACERNVTITRSYQTPKWVIPERSQCALSNEYILVVSCPWAF